MRQTAPAVGLLVVGRSEMIVKRVSRRSVVPAHAPRGLELLGRAGQAQAERKIVGVGIDPQGQTEEFLLNTVPEPTAPALVTVLCSVALLGRRQVGY